MMKTSPKGRKFIESFEGLILGAYDDASDHVLHSGDPVHGTLTIGYGHTDAAGAPTVFIGQTITKEQADAILANDLSKVEESVNRLVKVTINQNQFDALVSFQFNTGALGQSSALKLLNEGKYAEAADHLLLYNHAGGKVLAGLTRRRQAEKEMFFTKPDLSAGPVVAVAVGAGATATAVATQYHSPLIFLGIIAAALIVGIAVHLYANRKITNVV